MFSANFQLDRDIAELLFPGLAPAVPCRIGANFGETIEVRLFGTRPNADKMESLGARENENAR